MKIGQLRKQIHVQAEQPMPDGAGGYALAWATVATVWASLLPLSGREAFSAGHHEGRVTHKIIMRWPKDFALTADMRVLYVSRVFNIRAVFDDGERGRYATVLAEEGVAL